MDKLVGSGIRKNESILFWSRMTKQKENYDLGRDRSAYLAVNSHTLYLMSYEILNSELRDLKLCALHPNQKEYHSMTLGGIEPPTLRLKASRSAI